MAVGYIVVKMAQITTLVLLDTILMEVLIQLFDSDGIAVAGLQIGL